MRIAIVGGTHGNEPIGLEVIRALGEAKPIGCLHEYQTFQGNPKAGELQKRFVDCDLNRAFGKNAVRVGYEKKRAEEMETLFSNNFDLCMDIHTTTTNMGLTLILNNTHPLTQRACVYLKSKFPEIKLIEEDLLDEECTHLNRLAPSGITIEVGPVANNVINGVLVKKVYQMLSTLLTWDFSQEKVDLKSADFYKVVETIYYPSEKGWYIHPDIENNDFKILKKGAPLFVNLNEEIKYYEGEEVYPFFINEAAYLSSGSAMIVAEKKKGF